GEPNLHTLNRRILGSGLRSILEDSHPELEVYCNLDVRYLDQPRHERTGCRPYFSADIMAVHPIRILPEDLRFYALGVDGPAPLLALEILSDRSAITGDLDIKPLLYAKLGVQEFILLDPSREFIPYSLVMRRLQPDGTWKNEHDDDGGVTSRL